MSAIKLSSKDYYSQAKEEIKTVYPEKNIFDLPEIEKISINVGMGKYEQKQKNLIEQYLEKLTAQKPKVVKSRVSLAGFKLRKGDNVALTVSLRGKKVEDFLLTLIYLALPRTRDFRGTKKTSFTADYSCYSIGIENASIFPIVGFGTDVNFGMQINIVFKKPTEDNIVLLEKLNLPFKK
jgi:large subunit ribosomal protein L5